MIYTVKDLKDYLNNIPDDTYVFKSSFMGRPKLCICFKNTTTKEIDLPYFNYYDTKQLIVNLQKIEHDSKN